MKKRSPSLAEAVKQALTEVNAPIKQNVDPLGEGSGAQIRIAGLGLQTGDRLKYVYDFGYWIEHEITLEKVRS